MNKNCDTIMYLLNNYEVNRKKIINDKENVNFINTFVSNIYVINLDTDYIRRNYICVLMEKYKINYELIIVKRPDENQINIIKKINPDLTNGEIGCYLSHMYCYYDATLHTYNNIIIFEDDIIMHKNFNNLFEKTIKLQNYDILMLGASDFNFRKINRKFLDKTKNIYKPQLSTIFLYGAHAIFFSLKAYTEVFKNRLDTPTFIDKNFIQFCKSFNNSFYICFPSIVVPELSTSSLNHNFGIENVKNDSYYFKNCYNNSFNFTDYNFIYLKIVDLCLVNKDLTYEENIVYALNTFFRNNGCVNIIKIKMRLNYDFFTNNDLIYILDKNK